MSLAVLDRIDHRILEILQADNHIPNVNLAEQVGLSAPACSRRVARLREEGVIIKDVSIVDPRRVGKSVQVTVAVSLAVRRKAQVEAFRQKMLDRPEVVQCYMVAGSIDYFVVAVLADVESYAEFASDVFAGDDNVKSYESWFVLSHVKNETGLPLPLAPGDAGAR